MTSRREINLDIIKAVIFDCDGVMFDSIEANTVFYNRMLKRFDQPLSEFGQVNERLPVDCWSNVCLAKILASFNYFWCPIFILAAYSLGRFFWFARLANPAGQH